MKLQLKLNLNGQMVWVCVIAILFAGCLRAQDITGNWQGTITPPGRQAQRMIVRVFHDDGAALKAKIYSIDQGYEAQWLDFIAVRHSVVTFQLAGLQLSYEGRLSSNGNVISGTWTQGLSIPFVLHKATATAWSLPADPSHHTVQFVSVEPNVKLEVLDWGGTGRPLVFLAGLGDSAHAFDSFAPKFTGGYHVYGITRRGFGESSYPPPTESNYSSDRLGDDVLAVIAALHLNKPVLVGHSIGGEELSSIGSRHPEEVSGLIYLDSGGSYAFYDRAHGDLQLDLIDVRDKIEQFLPSGGDPSSPIQATKDLLAALPRVEKELQNQLKLQQAVSPPASNASPVTSQQFTTANPGAAVFSSERRYTQIKIPCLAIFAVPHDPRAFFPTDGPYHAAAVEADLERSTRLADAFEAGVPSAHVVRLHYADHYVYRSDEAEVFRIMNDFLKKLPGA